MLIHQGLLLIYQEQERAIECWENEGGEIPHQPLDTTEALRGLGREEEPRTAPFYEH